MTPSPKRNRRAAVLIRLIVASVGVVALGVGAVTAFSGDESSISNKELYTVGPLDFDVTSTASGELEARKQTELRCEVEGRSTITEVVDEGSMVKEGDLLVRLASDELEKNLDNELLNYESAKATLTSAENSLAIQKSDNDSALRAAELKLELARLDLDKWRSGDVEEKRNSLTLAIERGERELERTEKKYKRSQELYAEEFLSEDQMDQDEISYIEAKSQYETALLQKEVYETYTFVKEQKEKMSAVDEAHAELDRVKSKNASQLANAEAELSKARQQASIREEQVNRLKTQLSKTAIYAPTAGLVVYSTSTNNRGWRGNDEGPLEIGREVRHNEGLIVLPNTSEMMAGIKVHESLVNRISKGLIANVTIDAVPDMIFKGTVSSIGIVASDGGWRDPNNREYDVKILLDIDGNAYELKPSMRCEAEVIIEEVRGALAVPVHAIFSEGYTQFVYLEDGGRFKRTPVTVGSRSDTYVQITNGLAAGQKVLLHEPSPALIIPDEGFGSAGQPQLAQDASKAGQRRGGGGQRPQPAAE